MIVIGIPSYQEADTIAYTVEQIDRGLEQTYGAARCLIVNVDNDSDDGTRDVFYSTKTACKKHYISTGSLPRGKGKNLLRLLDFALSVKAQYIATFDADVATITSEWPSKLLDPLINLGIDYTLPIYSRNRFEGSVTNHFAYPLIYGLYGRHIRQPIGGEFGISRKLAEYLLKQEIISSTEQYGIDMFMTSHAVYGGFLTKEVFLGRKFHKPSFPKIVSIFCQEASSALHVAHQYRHQFPPQSYQEQSSGGDFREMIGIDREQKPTDPKAVKKLLETAKEYFQKLYPPPPFLPRELIQQLEVVIATSDTDVSAELWSQFLAYCVNEAIQEDVSAEKLQQLVALLTPVFLWRAATLWRHAVTMEPEDVEYEIRTQAEYFSRQITLIRG
ncbi:MAG: glycosyltransferase [Candidatus Andersenbacteria bacterium]